MVINSQPCGVVWKEPYCVDITSALHHGMNDVEIRVTNLWPNRIIGDLQKENPRKITYTHMQFYRQDSELLESGLLGPVVLKQAL